MQEGAIERRKRENRELEEEQAALLALEKFKITKTSNHREGKQETVVKKRNPENNISMLRERMDRERNAIKEWMDKRRWMAELKSIKENGAGSQNTQSPTLDNRFGGVSLRINTPKRKFENEPFTGEVNLETFFTQSPAKKRKVQTVKVKE